MDSRQNPKNFQLKTLEIKHNIEGKFKGAYTHYMEPEIRRRMLGRRPPQTHLFILSFLPQTHTPTHERR